MFSELLGKPGAMRGKRRVSRGQTKKGIKKELAEGKREPQKVLRGRVILVFAFLKGYADFSGNLETKRTKSQWSMNLQSRREDKRS